MKEEAKILILTPVKDAEAYLETYFRFLSELSYPHAQLSLGILEGDSQDKSYAMIEEKCDKLKETFRKVRLFQRDFGFKIPDGSPRWAGKIQLQRRTVLAKSRNYLLSRALDDEDWVLWMDVDLLEYPKDIIQRLLVTGKDIIQPNCVQTYQGKSFDQNAWRDKGKSHLSDLREEGDLVELHAVGGTMLLVKADIHREGLIFPPYLYGTKNSRIRNTNFFFANKKEMLLEFKRIPEKLLEGKYRGEIETEGLGIMANDMGHTCWGMPNLEILHG